jgi:ribonuclease HI
MTGKKKRSTPVYYGVHRGHQTGVFTDWNQVQPLVHGFSGAMYKKFYDIERAREFSISGNAALVGTISTRNTEIRVVDDRNPKSSESIPSLSELARSTNKRKCDCLEREKGSDPLMEENCVDVFCDGACPDNGKETAIASYGIFFGDNDSRNEYGIIPEPPYTSVRGELYAILRTIKIFKESPNQENQILRIFTDHQTSIDIFTKWMEGWKRRKFTTALGTKPKNLDLILPIQQHIDEDQNIRFTKVRAHAWVYGNTMADKLANKALDEYKKKKP